MAHELVIQSKYGGLGDLLFLSHLPRVAKQSGTFEKVFISTQSECRDPSYTELVWTLNPFVDGFKEAVAEYPIFETVPPGMNLLDKMMLAYGLDDGYRFHEPELYYTPKILPDYESKTVFDPNFVSGVGAISPDEIEAYFRQRDGLDIQLKPRQRSFPVRSAAHEVETSSLKHYCDIIYSCARFYCLTSGGATLAAALRKPAIAFYGDGQKTMFHHSGLHKYVNVSSRSVLRSAATSRPAPDIRPEVNAFFETVSRSVDPASVRLILDLGSRDANVALAFQDLFPNAKVVAFECNPEAIELCKRNLIGSPDIELVEKAVSDHSGPIDFYAIDPARTRTIHADGNIGASSLFVATDTYPIETYVQRRITVDAVTLADWLRFQSQRKIDVIWMDLQGAELKALKGLGNAIHCVRAIYTEVAFKRIYHDQPLIDELEAYLLKHGFERRAVLYADEWMGNVLYTRKPSLAPSITTAEDVVRIAVNCHWRRAEVLRFEKQRLELAYNPVDPAESDFVLDLNIPFSDRSQEFPPQRRLFATTEPSCFATYSTESVQRLSAYYPAGVLSWHTALKSLPQCKPWHALERWATPNITTVEKIYGLGGLISKKYVKGVSGYELRMKLLQKQNDLTIPGAVYNFQGTWKENAIPYPLDTKDASLTFMFHLAIENTAEPGYFTEKLLDPLVARCVPVYFGDPEIGRVFDERGIIRLSDTDFVSQLNALTSQDYYSRLPYINENYERSKVFWNFDLNLVRGLSSLNLIGERLHCHSSTQTLPRSSTSLPWAAHDVKRIAWVRSDAIGDTVLAMGMLEPISRHFPDANITVVCDHRNADLYRACPLVDEIIEFDRAKLDHSHAARQQLAELLGRLSPDICLNSVYSSEPLTEFLVHSCQARWNVGFSSHDNMLTRMRAAHDELHQIRIDSLPMQCHELHRHKNFLSGIGIDVDSVQPRVWLSEDDEQFANEIFNNNDLDPERTVVLFAGAQSNLKEYTHYASALREICREKGLCVLALGGPKDFSLNQTILDELHCRQLNLSGKATLRQGAAIIRRCRIAVGADTGLAHVACALNKPLVVVLGGGQFGRFFPYGAKTSAVILPLDCYGCDWNCKYTRPHCVQAIPTTVLQRAIVETFDGPSDKPRVFFSESHVLSSDTQPLRWKNPHELFSEDNVKLIEVKVQDESPPDSSPDSSDAPDPRAEPLVSICIITNSGLDKYKQRRDYLDLLLQSVQLAGFPARTEVIVVGAVGRVIDGIKIIELSEDARLGNVCALRNAGDAMAVGKWIIHCDDDVLFTPNYWNSLAAHLNDTTDIVCTKLLNPNGTRYWDWAAYYPGRGQTLLPYNASDLNTYATGGHAIYRRSIFSKIRWNEKIKHGQNEEFDLAAQARAFGLRFSLCQEATVFLQYHHCDAAAVINQTPQEPTHPCFEFTRLLSTLKSGGRIMDDTLDRVAHKLAKEPTVKVPYRKPCNPTVSILVCCHRFLQRFRIFAQALCSQDYDMERIELIVSNPHSPDGLSAYLRMLQKVCAAETNKKRFGPKIKEVLIDKGHFKNRGLMIQRAFENSDGSIVIGMDADIIVPPDFLQQVASAVTASHQHVYGFYRNFLSPSTTEKILAGLLNPIAEFSELLREDLEEEKGFRGILGYCQAASREHWARVGYPTEFDNIAESDVAFVDRLKQIGVTPVLLTGLSVLHLHHPRNWMGTSEFL